jgi:hypothetical protein
MSCYTGLFYYHRGVNSRTVAAFSETWWRSLVYGVKRDLENDPERKLSGFLAPSLVSR